MLWPAEKLFPPPANLQESSAKLAEARAAAEREAAKREAAAAPARRLVEALTQRGIQLTRPQVRRCNQQPGHELKDVRCSAPINLAGCTCIASPL